MAPEPGWNTLFWEAFKRSRNAMVLLLAKSLGDGVAI
jgi:hypothetical protein